MGTPREPAAVKYFTALLAADAALLVNVEDHLTAILGTIDLRSEIVPWTISNYYEQEMGPELLRRFVAFESLRMPDGLAAAKLQTQAVEEVFRDSISRGRRINLDPGYLDTFKVTLASTKNARPRIYLGSGIYGEVTLQYYSGAFHGVDSTYPDYLWPQSLAFLNRLRATYLEQLRR